MKLIDKNITDIISGYNEVLRAETDLRTHWRPHILAAYARRKATLDAESVPSMKQRIKILMGLLLGVGFSLIGIGFFCRGVIHYGENILWACCGGPLLIVLGLLILGATWFSLKTPSININRRVPLHPLRSAPLQMTPIKKGIYPDLRISWIDGLSGDLKTEVPDYPDYLEKDEKDHGAQGERIFIRRLHEIFDDRTFVLARLMQRPREDVDLILIGPMGIWVFEVKHWSGEVYWDDQGWRRVQTYYERGGMEVTRQPKVHEPPDQQWVRSAAQVSRTIKAHNEKVLARYPTLEQIRGGIVFTKEGTVLKCQSSRPVFWGTVNFWIKNLQQVDPKVNIDMHSTLQVVESLMGRHQELAPVRETRSMQKYAQGVVLEAERKLQKWVCFE